MKISFIIGNYNTSDLTIALVKSILEHCDFSKGDKEIIVIDDCSNEKEENKITYFFASSKFINSLIRLKENKGIGNAINEGIKEAKGKYIIRLDNDTLIIEKDFDEKLIKFLEEESKLGLVSCLTNNISSPSQKIVIPEVFKESDSQITEFVKNRDVEDIIYYNKPSHAFAGFCMAFRRSEIDLFDTRSKMFGEDNLKYLGYIKRGFKCGVAQKLFIRHLYHGTTKHMNPIELEENSKKAREIFLEEVNNG